MDHVAEPTRRAALVLHALSATDRDWILQRLPDGKSAALRKLLRELGELGIPADRELLAPFGLQAQATRGQSVEEDQHGMSVAQLCRMLAPSDPARLAVLLREEPPQLIAGFVQLHEWPWREQFIQHLGPLRRKQVGELLIASAGRQLPVRERAANRYLLNSIIDRIGVRPLQARGPGPGKGHPLRMTNWLRRVSASLRGRRAA